MIGYVAASGDPDGPYFATARFGGQVSVWDARSLTSTATFATVFAGVLGRIALSTLDGRPTVFAAALNEGHLAAYDGMSGELLWERVDIRPVHYVSTLDHVGRLAVTPDRGPLMIMDAQKGDVVSTIRGVRGLYASPTEGIAVATFEAKASLVDLHPWRTRRRLGLQGWALLDVAFGLETLLVSDVADEMPSAVYLFDQSGELIWRREVTFGWNVPWIAYDSETGEWLGVLQDPEQRAPHRLVRWSPDGSEVGSFDVGSAQDYAFVLGGRLLVNAQSVLDVRSGKVLARLTTG